MNISAIDTPVIEAYTTNAILGGNQNCSKCCYSCRSGSGNCAEEAGYNNAYNGDATSFMSHAGIYESDKSFGNSGFCHDISGKYEKWDSQKEKFTDSGIHIGCNDGKGGSGVQDCTDGGQSQTDCNGNSHDQENKK